MRRRIAVLLAGLMVCSMLTACGSTEEPKGEPEAEQGETKEEAKEEKEPEAENESETGGDFTEEVTLDIAMMWPLDSTTDAKSYALNRAIQRLEKDYPNIKVNYDGSVHDDYQTIMMTYAAADTLPDVFNVKGAWIPNLVENEQIGTVDEFFENDKDWSDKFDDEVLFDMEYDGHYYLSLIHI